VKTPEQIKEQIRVLLGLLEDDKLSFVRGIYWDCVNEWVDGYKLDRIKMDFIKKNV